MWLQVGHTDRCRSHSGDTCKLCPSCGVFKAQSYISWERNRQVFRIPMFVSLLTAHMCKSLCVRNVNSFLCIGVYQLYLHRVPQLAGCGTSRCAARCPFFKEWLTVSSVTVHSARFLLQSSTVVCQISLALSPIILQPKTCQLLMCIWRNTQTASVHIHFIYETSCVIKQA